MRTRTRTTAAIAALGLAASLAIAAAPDEGCYVALDGDPATEEDDVVACEEQQWFHRSTSHAGNVGYVDPTGTHGTATFDTNPPAGSVAEGNGAGYLTTQANELDDGLVNATFDGTFTGVLDRVDVDLHILASDEENLAGRVTVEVTLDVNGATIYSNDNLELTPNPEPASDAGSTRLDFAITGLAELLDSFGGALPNTADTTHEVTLKVDAHYTNTAHVFAFDTTEVPGGIGFNRVELPQDTHVLDAG